ncbi:PepSY domain-containing protein [Hyphomonas sp.]|uniref:PepSY-associated TM helix domain-containing protein n=1 Tax=Hyphomonas sp. TaxID=87 RepID=UPI0025BD06FF|nr:PepSY domain-containing protein [Hyphomonas sp.]MBI1399062.1 hypothetical protein [Hyphomonas sp.]
MASANRSTLQHRVWRWHFFAGLMVIPFAVILAITGAIYLFKPQFEAAVEARINARAAPLAGKVLPADDVIAAGIAAHPGASLVKLILPASPDDPTAEVELRGAGGLRTLWVDRTTGQVLHDTATPQRLMIFIKSIHGTLLNGNAGSLVVEVMASWMIILIITGVYLWWPRGTPWWRVFVPAFADRAAPRETWRKVHGMAGAWIGALVLSLLLSGLPWTQVWGDGFKRVKVIAGLQDPGQEWFVTLKSTDPHADHSGHQTGGELWQTGQGAPETDVESTAPMGTSRLPLAVILQSVQPEQYQPPVEVQPPRGENGVWTIRSMGPARPGRVTVHYDQWTGAEIMRIAFTDHNHVDQFVAQSTSFHEGALFGWFNQVLGVVAALGVILLSVSGAIIWWRRRPAGRLGTPPMPANRALSAGVVVLILCLGVFLPMAGLTLMAALIVDYVFERAGRRRAPH